MWSKRTHPRFSYLNVTIAIERRLEVVLKGFDGHDALVFVASEAHAGIKVDLVVAEAANEVGVESVHFLAFLSCL